MTLVEKCYQLAESHEAKKTKIIILTGIFLLFALGISLLPTENKFISGLATCLGLLGLQSLSVYYFIRFFGKRLSNTSAFDSNYMFIVIQEWLVALSIFIINTLIPLIILAIIF